MPGSADDPVALARIVTDPPDATALIQDAQALLEAFAGRDAAALLTSVTELCRLLAARGATGRAELLLRQMVPLGEQHLERDHAALGHVLHELAHLCLRDARYSDAEPLLHRLYFMQCRRCGRDHPDAAAVLASLARVRQALGRHDEAEAMWRDVIAVCERTLGSQHVATTTAVERLAESCAARGKVREAVHLRAQATTMRDTPARAVATPSQSLVVLPSANGALTVGEQPSLAAAAAGPSTQDALLAIHAELTAAGDARAGRRRRWPALAAAAAIIALLSGLTLAGPAAPVESALYEVRLAAEVPTPRAAADVPLVRAQLIGAVPQLAVPEVLADEPVGEDVVVRFAVDASGVPDTASMVVVHTPHDLLAEVVRRALPALRFEPAHRAVAGAPTEPDAVEMAFSFSREVR